MKMTIANRIKSELFNAAIELEYAETQYKQACPYGTNFCGDTVSSKAARMCVSLYEKYAAYQALAMLVISKKGCTDERVSEIIERYNNAETAEEAEAAEREYYSLFAIR